VFNILIISMCSTFLLSQCVQHSYYLNVFNILIISMCSTFLLSQCVQLIWLRFMQSQLASMCKINTRCFDWIVILRQELQVIEFKNFKNQYNDRQYSFCNVFNILIISIDLDLFIFQFIWKSVNRSFNTF
jgi:hypothetical protein